MSAPAVRERVLQFGEGRRLLGVASLPAQIDRAKPAVVVLNAGLIHRVGPFRMHVELARSIAERGTPVLRIDQSGLGDSLARPGTATYEERASLDAREAMAALTEHFGVERFVLVGLCAGALSAHRVARDDARVVGLCLLDGYAYRTGAHSLHVAIAKAGDASFWIKAGERAFAALLGGGPPAASAPTATAAPVAAADGASTEERPGADAEEVFAQDWPARELVERELGDILARGARALFVYTGGWSDYVRRDQFDEMFPGLAHRERAEVEYYPDADHTYLVVDHRERMIRRVAEYVASFR